MTKTSQTTAVTDPQASTELCHVFKRGDALLFEDNYLHFIMPGALEGVERVDVNGLNNAQIWFLDPLQGFAVYENSYRHDSGVLNLIDCMEVGVHNLVAQNTKTFSPANLITESSCVVNIQGGRVGLYNCDLTSNGKICVSAHSNAEVEIANSILKGYYFELLNAASNVTIRNSILEQQHADPDSHSLIWVGSSHRQAISNLLFENGTTLIENCTLKMHTGRALVSGNGSYHTRSMVTFKNCVLDHTDPLFGVCSWHENFNSITVDVRESGMFPTPDPPVPYVETPGPGVGGFVNYYGPPKATHRPGGPAGESPIFVNDWSSADV